MRILCKSGRVVATRHVTWAHVPTHIPSTPQQAILAPRENSSDGDESGEGQTPSAAVKSRPTSSEDDGSGGEGQFGGDSSDDVFLYGGVDVRDGLDDLDGSPQKTDERRNRYQRRLRAFNAKRTNRQGSVVTAGAADNRGLQQQMAAGDGGRVQESGGAREGRVIDSRGSLVRETSVKQESLSGEGRQPSLAGSYPGFRVAAQAPVEDVLRRDGQREESGTVRSFGPARESATMFGFGQGGLSRQFLYSLVNKSRFLDGNRKLLFTPDGMVLTRCSQGQMNARTLT